MPSESINLFRGEEVSVLGCASAELTMLLPSEVGGVDLSRRAERELEVNARSGDFGLGSTSDRKERIGSLPF
jgi:hypothetical protein